MTAIRKHFKLNKELNMGTSSVCITFNVSLNAKFLYELCYFLVPSSVGNKHITGASGGVKTDGKERRTDQRHLTIKVRDLKNIFVHDICQFL